MPLFEYSCADCGRLTEFLVRSGDAPQHPACEGCGSQRTGRRLSRVRRGRTDADVAAESTGEAVDDPRLLGRWVERRFEQYGMEIPDQAREVIDAAREGELPGPVDDL